MNVFHDKTCMKSKCRWYIVKSCIKIWRNKEYESLWVFDRFLPAYKCGCINSVFCDIHFVHVQLWQLCGCNSVKKDTVTSAQAGRKTQLIIWLISSNFDAWFNYVPPTYHALFDILLKDIHGLLLYRNYRNLDVTKTQCPVTSKTQFLKNLFLKSIMKWYCPWGWVNFCDIPELINCVSVSAK